MTTKISIHDLSKLSIVERNRLLQRTESDLSSFEEKVKPIIEAVRTEGDAALARFARQFDKAPVEAACHCRHRGRFRPGREDARSQGEGGAGVCRRFNSPLP